MKIITDWKQSEIEYIKSDIQRIRTYQNQAMKGATGLLAKQLRIQTAKLEKAVDSLDKKLTKPVLALEIIHQLASAVCENINFIHDNELPIEKDYKIWALIALRKYYSYVGDSKNYNKTTTMLTTLLSD